MTTKKDLPKVPDALAEAALVDAKTAAATGNASVSWWLEGVRRTREGELRDGDVPHPLPVIQQPRFTRWRSRDVFRFWIECAELAEQAKTRQLVIQRAKAASLKAREPAAVAKAHATRKARAAARAQSPMGGA